MFNVSRINQLVRLESKFLINWISHQLHLRMFVVGRHICVSSEGNFQCGSIGGGALAFLYLWRDLIFLLCCPSLLRRAWREEPIRWLCASVKNRSWRFILMAWIVIPAPEMRTHSPLLPSSIPIPTRFGSDSEEMVSRTGRVREIAASDRHMT